MAKMRRIVLDVDSDDHESIRVAVARYQAEQRVGGKSPLPAGRGDLLGRYVAEICRDYCDLTDWVAGRLGPEGG